MSAFRVPLLWVAAVLTFANAVFSAVVGLAGPQPSPVWASRVISAVFLLTAIAAGLAALGFWQAHRKGVGHEDPGRTPGT